MQKINGEPLQDDIDHIERITGWTVEKAHPAPQKSEKINPHVTRLMTADGKIHDVFHVKPVYYADKMEEWRPMTEIADEVGNHYIKLKADWKDKMHPKYLKWLSKRMDIVNKDKGDELVIEWNKDAQGNNTTPKKTVPSGLSEKIGQAYVKMPPQAIEALLNNPNW